MYSIWVFSPPFTSPCSIPLQNKWAPLCVHYCCALFSCILYSWISNSDLTLIYTHTQAVLKAMSFKPVECTDMQQSRCWNVINLLWCRFPTSSICAPPVACHTSTGMLDLGDCVQASSKVEKMASLWVWGRRGSNLEPEPK